MCHPYPKQDSYEKSCSFFIRAKDACNLKTVFYRVDQDFQRFDARVLFVL